MTRRWLGSRLRLVSVWASAMLATGVLVALVAAPVANAENTCETVTGEATVGEKTEKQKLKNALSTNLSEKQKLVFSWEGGKQKFKLQLLTRAACHLSPKGNGAFSGTALGTLNKEAGYAMVFTIKVNAEGVATLKAKIKLKSEIVEEFEEELEESTEEIA